MFGNDHRRSSFTLIELLLVIGIISVIAGIVVVAVNPGRQIAGARNAQRRAHVKAILEAISQQSIDSGSLLPGIDGTWRMMGTDSSGCDVQCGSGSTVSVSLGATADSWIFEWPANANDNYGSDGQVQVYPWSSPNVNKRGLIKFALSSIPAASTVNSATIHLLESGTRGFNRTLAFHRVTKDWTEFGATWNRYDGSSSWDAPGGDYHVVPSATALVAWGGGPLDWDSWDVRTDVQNFMSGAQPNFGWILKDTVEDDSQDFWFFHSREAASSSSRPFLSVEYGSSGDSGGVTASACLDFASALIPQYLASVPRDTASGDAGRTYYALRRDASDRLTVRACGSELEEDIVVSR